MSSFYLLSLRRCLWVHSQITGSIKCSFCDSLFYHKHAFQTTIFYVFSGEWGPTPPSSLYENVTCGRGKHQTWKQNEKFSKNSGCETEWVKEQAVMVHFIVTDFWTFFLLHLRISKEENMPLPWVRSLSNNEVDTKYI